MQGKGTHSLESAYGGTNQNKEIIQVREGHSLPKEHKGQNKSGHGEYLTRQGALTS